MRHQPVSCFLAVICILLIAVSTPAVAEPALRSGWMVIADPSAPAHAQPAALKAGPRGEIPSLTLLYEHTEPGAIRTLGVRLTSLGPGILEVTQVGNITGPDAGVFEITEDNCTGELLPVGEHCVIWVAFSPPDYGTYEAGFQVYFDDAVDPVTAIILLGVSIKDMIFKDRFED